MARNKGHTVTNKQREGLSKAIHPKKNTRVVPKNDIEEEAIEHDENMARLRREFYARQAARAKRNGAASQDGAGSG